MYQMVKDGDVESLKIEIENGADVNEKTDDYQWTLLHYASYNGHKDVCALLLDRGANVNAKNCFGDTPLHWASFNNDKDVCELLLSYGADINLESYDRETPMQMACRCHHEDVGKLFFLAETASRRMDLLQLMMDDNDVIF